MGFRLILSGILASSSVFLVDSSAYAGSIRSNCIQKWGTDYEMIEYCIKNQTSASSKVKRIPNNSIKSSCSSKWGEDYEMVEYCYKNQSGAKSRLGMSSQSPSRNFAPSNTSRSSSAGWGCITVGTHKECF